jgi:hypothetical protein
VRVENPKICIITCNTVRMTPVHSCCGSTNCSLITTCRQIIRRSMLIISRAGCAGAAAATRAGLVDVIVGIASNDESKGSGTVQDLADDVALLSLRNSHSVPWAFASLHPTGEQSFCSFCKPFLACETHRSLRSVCRTFDVDVCQSYLRQSRWLVSGSSVTKDFAASSCVAKGCFEWRY